MKCIQTSIQVLDYEGNGQVEQYNGIIWKEIVTCLKSKQLPVKYWQDVLADAYIRCAHFYAQRQTRHPMNVSLASPPKINRWKLYNFMVITAWICSH